MRVVAVVPSLYLIITKRLKKPASVDIWIMEVLSSPFIPLWRAPIIAAFIGHQQLVSLVLLGRLEGKGPA